MHAILVNLDSAAALFNVALTAALVVAVAVVAVYWLSRGPWWGTSGDAAPLDLGAAPTAWGALWRLAAVVAGLFAVVIAGALLSLLF